MAEQSQVHPLILAHTEDEPLVFWGPPGQVHGDVRLHNTSDEKVKLYTLELDTPPDIRGRGGEPLRHVQLLARILPQQRTSVPALLDVHPTTPPGTYKASVRLGNRRRAVVVHVTEKIDLQSEPSSVSFHTEGELVFQREFVVHNAGNVPLRLGPKCLAPLTDSMELQIALRHGLEEVHNEKEADVLRAFLRGLARQQVGNVSITREDVTLQPGETRAGPITFTFPDNLQSFRRYGANLALYNASLHLEIYTGDLRKDEARTRKRSKP
jgi:hypothetical protein